MRAGRNASSSRPKPIDRLALAAAKFQQASTEHLQGRFDAAQAAYLEVLKWVPNHFQTLHLLGMLQYQIGNAAAAVDLIEQAIQLEPGHAAHHSHLGLALQALGRTDDALHHFGLALMHDPGYLPALNNRGNTLNRLGRASEALADFDRFLVFKPDSVEALTNRGLVLQDLERYEEALESHELALQLQPTYTKALNNRGNMLRELGRPLEAQVSFEQAIAQSPEFAEAYNNLGVTLRELGRREDALRSFDRALGLQPDLVNAHNNRGMTLRELGRSEEALVSHRRAVQLQPEDAQGWSNCGCALCDLQRPDAALDCFERALQLQPDSVVILNNRGNTLLALGRYEAALASYERALQIATASAAGAETGSGSPQSKHRGPASAGFETAVTHSNLAYLHNILGHGAVAEFHARQAIDIDPSLADAYLNLAQVEAGRLRYGEALRLLDTLQDFAPRHASALILRTQILRQSERFEEALDCARRALALALPVHQAEAHKVFAQVLQALNRHDKAMQQFELAAALPGPIAEDAMIGCAILLLEQGRKAEAMAAFDRAQAAFPASTRVLIGRADAKTFQAGDPDIARLETLLATNQFLPLNDRLTAHFALGKAYLDFDDVERAFEHFDTGNRKKRATYPYDSGCATAWLRHIAACITPEWLNRMAGAGAASELPVFVIGMPRSGTTMVEQILSSHSEVMGAGELPALRLLVDSSGEFPGNMATLTHAAAAQLGEAYLSRVTPRALGHARLLDKMPANFLYAGLIAAILPGARIIHCRRDPADTCLSCYTKLFAGEQLFAYEQTELGEFYLAYRELMTHWRAMLPAARFLEVDYEDVVNDPEGQTQRMVDFLGLPWDEACLQFADNTRVVRTASVNQVRQPIHGRSIGRWKRYAEYLGPLLAALEGAGR